MFGALLTVTDLFEAFGYNSSDIFLGKLQAYGFSFSALNVILSYLKNRKQETKIDSMYSSWEEIIFGAPQGSILGLYVLIMSRTRFRVSPHSIVA